MTTSLDPSKLDARAGVSLSADGRLLAINNENNIDIWSTDDLTRRCTLTGHAAKVNALAFSPVDSNLPFSSQDYGKEALIFSGRARRRVVRSWDISPRFLSFSADGRRLVVASQHITVWDVGSLEQVFELKTIGSMSCVALNMDGTRLAVGLTTGKKDYAECVFGLNDYKAALWDLDKKSDPSIFKGHFVSISRALGFTSCGNYLVTASRDSTIRFWEVSTNRMAGVLDGDPSEGLGPGEVYSLGLREHREFSP